MKDKHLFYIVIFVLALIACASPGNPDGGRYDDTPPKVLQCFPEDKSTGVNKKKVSILFNEYIKLQGANEKVIVSPPQIEAANIRADGKKVKIDLFDSLQENTTYTIDFSDAIEDNNEGNPMGMYTYSFSTGESIDTMEISGTILNAEDLEPIKGILVGLYPADSTFDDSLFTTTPFKRVSRTNGSGRFTIKGVKPGRYHAFALKDADGNFIFNQKSEMVAFDTASWITSFKPDVRMDTCWRDTTTYDSIRVIPYTHFLPDDIVLRAFLEGGQDRHLLKTERAVPENFKVFFTAPSDSLPVIKGLNFDESCLFVETNEGKDTLTYWVTDTTYSYQQDTLTMAITYLDTDTLGQLVPKTDTLEMASKLTREKQLKEQLKKIEDWEKERQKKQKKAKEPLPEEENPYTKTFIDITGKPSGSLDPNQNVRFTANEPIAKLDSTKLHFYMKQDSDWIPVPYLFLPVENDSRSYTLYAEWEPKGQYRFESDSTAFISILGHESKATKQEFRIRDLEEFGTLFVHILDPDSNVIVQVMGKSDKPIYEQRVNKEGWAEFYYMKPSDYYLRCIYDTNGNGKWDTGSYSEGIQPELVCYYPKPIKLKALFEISQDWNPKSINLAEQKAKEITKQKPDKEKTIRDKNKMRDEEKKRAKSGKSSGNNRSGSMNSSGMGNSMGRGGMQNY